MKTKRIVSLILAILVTLTALPMAVFADSLSGQESQEGIVLTKDDFGTDKTEWFEYYPVDFDDDVPYDGYRLTIAEEIPAEADEPDGNITVDLEGIRLTLRVRLIIPEGYTVTFTNGALVLPAGLYNEGTLNLKDVWVYTTELYTTDDYDDVYDVACIENIGTINLSGDVRLDDIGAETDGGIHVIYDEDSEKAGTVNVSETLASRTGYLGIPSILISFDEGTDGTVSYMGEAAEHAYDFGYAICNLDKESDETVTLDAGFNPMTIAANGYDASAVLELYANGFDAGITTRIQSYVEMVDDYVKADLSADTITGKDAFFGAFVSFMEEQVNNRITGNSGRFSIGGAIGETIRALGITRYQDVLPFYVSILSSMLYEMVGLVEDPFDPETELGALIGQAFGDYKIYKYSLLDDSFGAGIVYALFATENMPEEVMEHVTDGSVLPEIRALCEKYWAICDEAGKNLFGDLVDLLRNADMVNRNGVTSFISRNGSLSLVLNSNSGNLAVAIDLSTVLNSVAKDIDDATNRLVKDLFDNQAMKDKFFNAETKHYEFDLLRFGEKEDETDFSYYGIKEGTILHFELEEMSFNGLVLFAVEQFEEMIFGLGESLTDMLNGLLPYDSYHENTGIGIDPYALVEFIKCIAYDNPDEYAKRYLRESQTLSDEEARADAFHKYEAIKKIQGVYTLGADNIGENIVRTLDDYTQLVYVLTAEYELDSETEEWSIKRDSNGNTSYINTNMFREAVDELKAEGFSLAEMLIGLTEDLSIPYVGDILPMIISLADQFYHSPEIGFMRVEYIDEEGNKVFKMEADSSLEKAESLRKLINTYGQYEVYLGGAYLSQFSDSMFGEGIELGNFTLNLNLPLYLNVLPSQEEGRETLVNYIVLNEEEETEETRFLVIIDMDPVLEAQEGVQSATVTAKKGSSTVLNVTHKDGEYKNGSTVLTEYKSYDGEEGYSFYSQAAEAAYEAGEDVFVFRGNVVMLLGMDKTGDYTAKYQLNYAKQDNPNAKSGSYSAKTMEFNLSAGMINYVIDFGTAEDNYCVKVDEFLYDATVTLKKGTETVATQNYGKFRYSGAVEGFSNCGTFYLVDDGVYNLVLENAEEGFTKTILVEVKDGKGTKTAFFNIDFDGEGAKEKQTELVILDGKTEAEKTDGGMKNVVVEGLNNAIDESTLADASDIKTVMTVEKIAASDMEEESNAIAVLASGKDVSYLELNVYTDYVDEENESHRDPVTETEGLLTVYIPYDTSRSSISVLRYHDGQAEIIPNGAGSANGDGEYWEVSNGYIVLHVKKFSLYAVAYKTATYVATVKKVDDYSTCKKDEKCIMNDFSDLQPTRWFHDAVHYCIQNGLMNGDNGVFNPLGNMTRAELVQILYNMAGNPETELTEKFEDVESFRWFAPAVSWAEKNGIVEGLTDTIFAPTSPITREQLSTILYKYAKLNGQGFTGDWMFQLPFTDTDRFHDYAIEGAAWCKMNGIIEGYEAEDGTWSFKPRDYATRAEASQMIFGFDLFLKGKKAN